MSQWDQRLWVWGSGQGLGGKYCSWHEEKASSGLEGVKTGGSGWVGNRREEDVYYYYY